MKHLLKWFLVLIIIVVIAVLLYPQPKLYRLPHYIYKLKNVDLPDQERRESAKELISIGKPAIPYLLEVVKERLHETGPHDGGLPTAGVALNAIGEIKDKSFCRKAAKGKDIRIQGGANTIQQFLNAGLVDEFFIHIAPVFLGSGIRLFDGIDKDKYDIQIVEIIPSDLTTHLRYKLTKK